MSPGRRVQGGALEQPAVGSAPGPPVSGGECSDPGKCHDFNATCQYPSLGTTARQAPRPRSEPAVSLQHGSVMLLLSLARGK